jgi:hypothetical protein
MAFGLNLTAAASRGAHANASRGQADSSPGQAERDHAGVGSRARRRLGPKWSLSLVGLAAGRPSGAAGTQMGFDKLTAKHGFRLLPKSLCREARAAMAFADL